MFFFVIYCLGIPYAAYRILRRYIDGIHYDPMRAISPENPKTPGHELDYVENDATRILLMREKHTSHQSFGFLWQGLNEKGHAPYWEASAVTLRKLFMIFIVMMFQDSNKNIQMVIALMGLFVFTASHINVKPYDSFVHDKLEILSLFVSQTTMFVGLIANFLKDDQKSDRRNLTEVEAENWNLALGGVIVFCNLIFMLYFSINLLYHAFFMLDEKVQVILHKLCGCCYSKKKKGKKDSRVKRTSFSLDTMDYAYHNDTRGSSGVEMAQRGSSIQQKINQVIQFTVPKGSGPGKKLVLKGLSGERFAVIVPDYAFPGTSLTFTLNPKDGGKHVRRSVVGAQGLNDTIDSLGSLGSDSENPYDDSDDHDDDDDSDKEEQLHLVI